MGKLREIGRAIDDTFIQPVVGVVKDVGRGIDDLVHDVIPGGWATVGAGALLAVGIYNPSLLAAAESGTLTTGALEAAGVDAAATATAVAGVSPEVAAATAAASSSGVAPEIIAMANATTDPIAALAAAQGSTVVDTAYLASIGAPETLIATATANNAALAAQAAETAGTTAATGGTETAATGGTETAATGPATPEPPGTNTQVFDDGSKLVTDANGRIVSVTNADGTNFVPVEDLSGTGIPGLKPGPENISLAQGATDYAKAVYDSLGPLGTAALVGGGTLAAKQLLGGNNLNGNVGSGNINYQWGTAPELINPGLNPGYVMQAASAPHYQSTNPTDAQYYWGVHNPVNTPEDLNKYNELPNAPVTPWGAGPTAVGGQTHMDIPAFVSQYITNPAYANMLTGNPYTQSQAQAAAQSAGPVQP